MDDNFNTTPNNENENQSQSDSLYSYSYVGQEKENNNNLYYTSDVTGGEGGDRKEEDKKEKKVRKKGFGSKLMKCTAFALVFGLVSGTVFHGTGYLFDYAKGDTVATSEKEDSALEEKSSDVIPVTNTASGQVNSDIPSIVEQVMPSVVSITNLSDVQYRGWYGETYSEEAESGGSGIIIGQTEEEIYIATNNHVVSNAKSLSVTFFDDETITAEVKGTDSDTDLAVLSIPVKNIPAETLEKIKVATLGDSDQLKVGEGTIAIGNALGYGQSVTDGVISALNREVTIADESTGQYTTNELIQTSAAINPGNSGGALLNMKGEVIGINSVKYSAEEVEGMGYAIPISTAKPILDDLINREEVDASQTAYLGISGVDVTDDASNTYNMPSGVYVGKVVEGSAAGNAGIMQGDIITGFDGKTIKSMEKLQDQLKYYEAGAEVEITIQRAENGQYQEHNITVTLGKKN